MKKTPDKDGVQTTTKRSGRFTRSAGFALAALTLAIAAYIASTDARRGVHQRADLPPQAAVPGRVAPEVEPVKVSRRVVHARRKTAADNREPETISGEPAEDTAPAAKPPEISAAEYIAALRAAGETEGLAAFSPPGTRPPNPGVLVPDDYELPEGFMRHYQSTDDGGQLAAVLTLSPDYELYDENGNPIPLPQDRIVPPELAPPDLPIRILEIPSSAGSTTGRR